MKSEGEASAGKFTEAFDARAVSDSMLGKLLQAEKDGERFWRLVSNRIRIQKNRRFQEDTLDAASLDKSGVRYLTPIAKIQIGMLGSCLLLAMLLAIIVFNIKEPLPDTSTSTSHQPEHRKAIDPAKRTIVRSEGEDVSPALTATAEEVHSKRSQVLLAVPKFVKKFASHTCKAAWQNTAVSAGPGSDETAKTSDLDRPQRSIIAARNRLERTAEEIVFAPAYHLCVACSFNRSGYGQLSINGEVTIPKTGPREIAAILPYIEMEIKNRVSFIGPRIGRVHGTAYFEFRDEPEVFEFADMEDLSWAIQQLAKKLNAVNSKFRQRGKESEMARQHRTQSVARINEVFQQWANESLNKGGTAFKVKREDKTRFMTIISEEAFKDFAESGQFELPQLDQLFVPLTTIQRRNAEAIKHDLEAHRKLNLFANSQDFKVYSDSIASWKAKQLKQGTRSVDLVSDEPITKIVSLRADLSGLPMLMGDDCKIEESNSLAMNDLSVVIGPMLSRLATRSTRATGEGRTQMVGMVSDRMKRIQSQSRSWKSRHQYLHTADQMLQAQEPDLRHEMVEWLSEQNSLVAAKLLSCYVKYDLDPGVRMVATKALAKYSPKRYRQSLWNGLDYPWIEANRHSVEALVRLNDKASIPYLVEKLKSDDPRSPRSLDDGRFIKKELVAINHMKNCLLCHADSHSTRDKGRAPVPEWDRPLPPQYYQSQPRGLVVRADVTYLRQDFSVMLDVLEKPEHWPSEQRFDFLVQERELSYGEFLEARERHSDKFATEYRDAILFGLRTLTGLKPSDNSYENWLAVTQNFAVHTP